MSISPLRTRLLAGGWRQQSLVFPRRGGHLHAMLTSCGVQQATAPDYDWDGQSRGQAELVVFQYSLAGCGLLTWEGEDRLVPPGSAMLVRVPHDHRYRVSPQAGHWQFLYICATGREVVRATGRIHETCGPILQLAIDGPALAVAMGIVESGCAGQLTSPFRASGLAYSLVMSVLDEMGGASLEVPTRRLTQAAAEYCREHLADPVSVRTLARLCGLSQWHFSRLFKAEHGLAPGAFLQMERVREAARLLRNTDAPLKGIALQCGYLDANYLGKVFSRHMGVSPGAFRRSGV